jgi:dolichol-phosphate mannosyltransferase
MFRDRRLAVVVPCFNVGSHVADVVRSLPAFVDHIIVVDDGSVQPVAGSLADVGVPTVVVLRHDVNQGLARAMETGFKKALELGAQIVVKVDGDGQMDPGQMSRLLEPVVGGQADIAKGNRFLRRRHLIGMPIMRLAGNLVLSFLTKMASGYWNVFDPTNGYLAIRRQVLEEIELARLGPRHFFEISLLCQAYLAGAVVRDVAIPARYGNEKSSLSVHRTMASFPYFLMRAWLRRVALQHFIRDFTPVALFLLMGGAACSAGVAVGLFTWIQNASLHRATPPGTIAVIALPVLVGFQLLLQAVVLDISNAPARSPWAGLDS